jgi:hypothetical protein
MRPTERPYLQGDVHCCPQMSEDVRQRPSGPSRASCRIARGYGRFGPADVFEHFLCVECMPVIIGALGAGRRRSRGPTCGGRLASQSDSEHV